MKDCDTCRYGDPKTVICSNPKRCVTYDKWEENKDTEEQEEKLWLAIQSEQDI